MARPRFVVEVAGPAGSGKSTVSRWLTQRSQVVAASIWGLPRPLYAASAVRVLPAIGALVGAARWLPWEETEQLIRLDAIVLLDGADPLLVERLRSRAKAHPLKQSSDEELYEFAAAYRRAFEWVIAGMTAGGRAPKVVALESNGAPPEELAEQVLAACQETVHAD